MKREELLFDRPSALDATRPPEDRGLARDEVAMLVSDARGDRDARFRDLPSLLAAGDLLVVNASATVPASLPAHGEAGPFRVHLSTRYSKRLWLAEPRWSDARPGPLPLAAGATFDLAGVPTRVVAEYPGIPRLWFLAPSRPIERAMAATGRPIRYGYLDRDYPLERYQTVFAQVPGSAEMPSAGRPFSATVLDALAARGVHWAPIVLHTGVSSLELTTPTVEEAVLYPEPFHVPERTVRAIEATHARGGRVIAVGTTVVRALESAWDGHRLVSRRGFTRVYVRPGRPPRSFDGLLTGFHDSATTHLALLYAVAGADVVRRAYRTAVDRGYRWHEFGDVHLFLPRDRVGSTASCSRTAS